MAIIDLNHPAAETDASSLEFILDVVKALDPQPCEVEKWERLLAQYREMGPRFIATQRAADRILAEICRLNTELEGILCE